MDQTEHHLKTWPEHWREVATGRKTFEIRKDDRGYRVGDVLVLREYDPALAQYTGQVCTRYVTHVLRGGQFGLDAGHVCMSLAMPLHRIVRKLPVDYDLARKIADAAMELFIECRDVHGMDEARARLDAVTTVAEGASTPDDLASGPDPGTPGFNSHTWRQQRRHPQVEHVPHGRPDGTVCWGITEDCDQ